jgi:hypothetical protein
MNQVWIARRCFHLIAAVQFGFIASVAGAYEFQLTASNQPVCSLVVLGNTNAPLAKRAVESIVGTVKRWSTVELPVQEIRREVQLPERPCIVLATFDDLKAVVPKALSASPEFSKVRTADEHAFALVPAGDKLFVVSRSLRGVQNGAIYLSDFLIDGAASRLTVRGDPVFREPKMKGRPAYTLTIWGNEAEYTSADWGKIFQAFARDGVDRVYFWTSGHFPSKKFPQTYKCVNGEWDTTVNSRIGTLADLRAIIQHAHDLGLKFYHGGGLGGWCGTGLITNKKPGTMKTGPKEAPWSLCPSNPESRTGLIDYYTEMFDALPEADGLYIELGEEFGECLCAECAKPVDKLGSKQFGQSILTLAREIADRIRRKHSHAKFAFTIGYDEHAHDPAFHRLVQEMGDEYYEWMEARGRWEFIGPDGKDLPAATFSKHVMKWKQWYNFPLDTLVSEANRAARSDFYGLITSFEPGFASGSFYKSIPFPTDLLPYVLTGFAYREMSWEPTLSLEELKQRVRQKFFGNDGSPQLVEELLSLRELMRHAASKKPLSIARRKELTRIADVVDSAWPAASPKARDGLELMRKAIDDTQEYLKQVTK